MHACMCVCMFVCLYVCMHACMHVCIYACLYVCMHACMHLCMFVCLYVFEDMILIIQWMATGDFWQGACTQHGAQLHGFLAGILHTLGPNDRNGTPVAGREATWQGWTVKQWWQRVKIWGFIIFSMRSSTGWWYTYPSEKWWSSSMGFGWHPFSMKWKIKFIFQTTKQSMIILQTI